MFICLEQGGNDLHMVQLMSLPWIGLTFLVLASPGRPRKRL